MNNKYMHVPNDQATCNAEDTEVCTCAIKIKTCIFSGFCRRLSSSFAYNTGFSIFMRKPRLTDIYLVAFSTQMR